MLVVWRLITLYLFILFYFIDDDDVPVLMFVGLIQFCG